MKETATVKRFMELGGGKLLPTGHGATMQQLVPTTGYGGGNSLHWTGTVPRSGVA